MSDNDKKKKRLASKCEGLPDMAVACPHHSDLVYYFCDLDDEEDKKEMGLKSEKPL